MSLTLSGFDLAQNPLVFRTSHPQSGTLSGTAKPVQSGEHLQDVDQRLSTCTSTSRQGMAEHPTVFTSLPSDLEGLAALWPTLSESIRTLLTTLIQALGRSESQPAERNTWEREP